MTAKPRQLNDTRPAEPEIERLGDYRRTSMAIARHCSHVGSIPTPRSRRLVDRW